MLRNQIILYNSIISIVIIFLTIDISLADEFNYPPIKRESSEWKNMSPEQRHKVCQISKDILASLTTDQLINAYLDYPYIGVIWAFNNWIDGFNRVYQDFNGLRELLKRKDVAKKVLQYYCDLDPGAYESSWSDYDKGAFTFRFMYLEMILSLDSIQNQLQAQEIEDLLKIGVKKYDQKLVHSQLHSKIGLKYTALPLGKAIRLINSNNYQDLLNIQGMTYFLTTGHCGNDEIINNIIQEARKH